MRLRGELCDILLEASDGSRHRAHRLVLSCLRYGPGRIGWVVGSGSLLNLWSGVRGVSGLPFSDYRASFRGSQRTSQHRRPVISTGSQGSNRTGICLVYRVKLVDHTGRNRLSAESWPGGDLRSSRLHVWGGAAWLAGLFASKALSSE